VGLFVKICGIASEEDARGVAELAPDAMGFNLWPSSKRYAPPEHVAEWVRRLPPSILKVGVFVDADPEAVRETLFRTGLDVAQLHGKEKADDFRAAPFRMWKALPLVGDVAAASEGWRVDAFLVDTYSSQLPGGTGQVGDWTAARRFVAVARTPVLLAGGLDPDNVQDAIRAVQPWGVDVSSGVEDRPGRKDMGRVKAFIDRCREV
jgi:phosphoribosylanthranilate isomerase